MPPTKRMTEYERQRLENIRRNDEMMAALKLHTRAAELSAASKRQKTETKSYKTNTEKKPKEEPPVVIRRSLRTRGLAPESKGLKDDDVDGSAAVPVAKSPKSEPKPSPRKACPIPMADTNRGSGSHFAFIKTVRRIANKSSLDSLSVRKSDEVDGYEDKPEMKPVLGVKEEVPMECRSESKCSNGTLPDQGSVKYEENKTVVLDIGTLTLKEENIARIVPGRIMTVKFFPTVNLRMIVVGNKFGNISFWNMNPQKDEADGIFMYYPHTAPVSGISIPHFDLSKMFTSSYDGFIRLMDVEKEMFDLLYDCDEAIFSLCQQPNTAKCLYFGEGRGTVKLWDERAGKSLSSWGLHDDRINTIDFHPQNPFIMATSSSDGTACIWDIRNVNADQLRNVRVIAHEKAVHSAFFSPSGSFLASTSYDNSISLVTGPHFKETSKVYHDNRTSRWISSFRAIWGWDDSYVFIGNTKRAVDVISTADKRVISTLESPYMTAIPCRFAAHPFELGLLAGATGGGQVYTWTTQ